MKWIGRIVVAAILVAAAIAATCPPWPTLTREQVNDLKGACKYQARKGLE